MATDEALPFGVLLSRYRVAVGLTQEELAERAGLSPQAISALERGIRSHPRAYTVRHLVDALGLTGRDREVFEASVLAAPSQVTEDVMPTGDFLGALPAIELVGRTEEEERIHAVLGIVTEGSGYVLLLSGETGVGKTRLLQELMQEARARGVLVLTARCYPTEQATPYYPFLDALAGLVARLPASARCDGQRAWKKVQELARSTAPGHVAGMGTAVEQQQLFDAVSHLLLEARSTPVALLLDDLHWADDGSMRLFRHLAHTTHHAPVLLAGSFLATWAGENHPRFTQLLQTLSRERLAERMVVRRLSLEETTTLVAQMMRQQEVAEEFVSFVYRRTKGVPRLIHQLVQSLGGRLELQGEIGAGAMGRVFRALDRTTGQTVAAKLVLARSEIDLEALLRFQQEGAVLAKLDHPNIVKVYDTFVEEHASCIIMELLNGQPLGRILEDGPLSLPRAQHLALQVAEALAYAHTQSIVHRDIKPDNVMVTDADRVKVTDFGIARLLPPDTSLGTMATTGMRMGTPLYMAPEQIGSKQVDGRADIYALGAMLYHMVTGRPPFEGDDALEIVAKQLQEEPAAPSAVDSSIPAHWDAMILKAMAKDPSKRFQSAGEMGQELRSLDGQVGTRVERPRARRQPLSGAWVPGVVAVVLVVAMAVLVGERAIGTSRVATPLRVDPARAIVAVLRSSHLGIFMHGAFTPGAFWVINNNAGTVVRFDTRTNREAALVRAGDPRRDPDQNDPFDVVSGDGQLWTTDRADRAVVRIDPRTNKVIAHVHIGILCTSLAIVGNTLWAAADPVSPPAQTDNVVRVSLRTEKVVGVLHAGSPLGIQMAATNDAVWVSVPNATAEIERLAPHTGKIAASISTVPQPESLAVGAGAVWVLNQQGTTVTRIDPHTNNVAATIDLSRYPGRRGGGSGHDIVAADGAVWAIARTQTLVRISPVTNRIVATLSIKQTVDGLAVGDGAAWVGSPYGSSGLTEIIRVDIRAMRGT